MESEDSGGIVTLQPGSVDKIISDTHEPFNVESLSDYETKQYNIKDFVVDYVCYRLSLDGLAWHERPDISSDEDCPYHALMRRLAYLFEQKNSETLNSMAASLVDDDEYLTQYRFTQVVNEFIPNSSYGTLSYGRLIALVSFCGLFSKRMAQENYRDAIASIVLYTSKYLQQRIQHSWHLEGLSWANFLELSPNDVSSGILNEEALSRQKYFHSKYLMKYAMVGMAAAIVFVTWKMHNGSK